MGLSIHYCIGDVVQTLRSESTVLYRFPCYNLKDVYASGLNMLSYICTQLQNEARNCHFIQQPYIILLFVFNMLEPVW